MAMTDAERRAARNAASRKWYLAHKADAKTAKAAKNKLPKAKPVSVKRAKAADTSKLEKTVDKFVEKGVKTADAYRGLVKSAASVLADVFKSGNDKLVAKTCKAFGKKLNLEVKPMPENGKAEISVSVGAKLFSIPKSKNAVQPEQRTDTAEPDEPKEKVVAVDPSLLTGIEDGTVSADDVDSEGTQPDFDDEDDIDDDDADLDGIDPDEMTDEQLERYEERERRRADDEWQEGRSEAMRELAEQGAFDGFEN